MRQNREKVVKKQKESNPLVGPAGLEPATSRYEREDIRRIR
jgi:hypothetical protein